jgi:hypothetical protein
MLILKELTSQGTLAGLGAGRQLRDGVEERSVGILTRRALRPLTAHSLQLTARDQSCLNGPQSEAIFMTGVHGEFGNSEQGREEILKLKNKRAAEGCRS